MALHEALPSFFPVWTVVLPWTALAHLFSKVDLQLATWLPAKRHELNCDSFSSSPTKDKNLAGLKSLVLQIST